MRRSDPSLPRQAGRRSRPMRSWRSRGPIYRAPRVQAGPTGAARLVFMAALVRTAVLPLPASPSPLLQGLDPRPITTRSSCTSTRLHCARAKDARICRSKRCGAWPAIRASPSSPRTPRARRSPSVVVSASCRRRYGGRCGRATAVARSRVAATRASSTPTTSDIGAKGAKPASPTQRCSAAGTIAWCTKAHTKFAVTAAAASTSSAPTAA